HGRRGDLRAAGDLDCRSLRDERSGNRGPPSWLSRNGEIANFPSHFPTFMLRSDLHRRRRARWTARQDHDHHLEESNFGLFRRNSLKTLFLHEKNAFSARLGIPSGIFGFPSAWFGNPSVKFGFLLPNKIGAFLNIVGASAPWLDRHG